MSSVRASPEEERQSAALSSVRQQTRVGNLQAPGHCPCITSDVSNQPSAGVSVVRTGPQSGHPPLEIDEGLVNAKGVPLSEVRLPRLVHSNCCMPAVLAFC